MSKKGSLIVGLDIGTTKICSIVAEETEDGLDIIGIGTHPSKGLRKGVIVNIDATVEAIRRAVEECELMAGCDISTVYAGISGNHVEGFNSHGIVAIKEKEVKDTDVARVIDAAQAVALPMDREVIHVLPQEYVVDQQDGIRDPIGMNGVRLEAKVHIVSASIASGQNIIKCANRCGLNVDALVLQPLAASRSVLSADEKELGVVMVDIGGGTTDIVAYLGGSLVYTSVLSLGGGHVTNDIAVGLRTPAVEADRIKQKYGCALGSMVHADETIEVPSVGGRKPRVLPRQILSEIIEPRMEELFSLVKKRLKESGYEELMGSGVVITGGASLMEGVPELAEQVFDMPVRRGFPKGVGGLVDVVKNPMYSAAVGLVLYGVEESQKKLYRRDDAHLYGKVKDRMRQWLGEFF